MKQHANKIPISFKMLMSTVLIPLHVTLDNHFLAFHESFVQDKMNTGAKVAETIGLSMLLYSGEQRK